MSSKTELRPWYVPMRARHPGETHRVSTPLELLFDLCFVVAVAQAAAGLDAYWAFLKGRLPPEKMHSQ